MLGGLSVVKDYSKITGTMQVTHSNGFFAESFGRNDFEKISPLELKRGNTINYILKYIEKSGERIVYSRGIPTQICKKMDEKEVAAEMFDFVHKYVLFDDSVSWERDIMHYTSMKQVSFIDVLCNPPLSA